MSKLDKKPMQQAQLSKSSHDLSHTYDYTSSTGMILPLVHDLLNPGESIQCKIDLSDTRTMPLQAAAYLDLDLHVDYFFVPMDMIFSNFNSFIYRIKEYYSSANFPIGDQLPLMDLANFKTNIYANYSQKVISGDLGLNFDELAKGSTRLLEHLGFGSLRTGVQTFNPNVFPYALCAYNAIYQYYFRNDEYETLNQSCYNLDNIALQSITTFDSGDISSSDFCSLRYRDKYHDYFTRVKSSPIVSANNIQDYAGSLSLSKSWLTRPDPLYGTHALIDGSMGSPAGDYATSISQSPDVINALDTRTNFGFHAFAISSQTQTDPSLNGADINTANLRALFANEKLWTITGMNRKQYDAQTLAHYGYNVPVDVMHQCQHIGHHLYQVHVGEVISTSGTTTQPLATVAGKGYAFENKDGAIKFTAPCHGVFMAVYSSAIHRNYFNNFRKENAVATWQDFYQPEFDHLGMQPMFRFEALQDNLDDRTTSPDSLNGDEILGWQYRYEQFKCRYDRASSAFASGFRTNGLGSSFYGPFSSWSPSELAFESSNMINNVFQPSGYWKYVLKENPCELNHIMAVSYDPAYYTPNESQTLNYYTNPWQLYATDPLVHHAFIDYKKLSTMSAYSMPRMDA